MAQVFHNRAAAVTFRCIAANLPHSLGGLQDEIRRVLVCSKRRRLCNQWFDVTNYYQGCGVGVELGPQSSLFILLGSDSGLDGMVLFCWNRTRNSGPESDVRMRSSLPIFKLI